MAVPIISALRKQKQEKPKLSHLKLHGQVGCRRTHLKNKNKKGGAGKDLRAMLFFQRTQVQFLTPTWQLTTEIKPSFLVHQQEACTWYRIHADKIHIHKIKIK